jgi:hypothetical protein
MIPQCLIVKDEVLEHPPFYRHDHCLVRGIQGSDYTFGPNGKAECVSRAIPDADTATKAEFFVEVSLFLSRLARVVRRDEAHRLNNAGIHAFPTSIARSFVNHRQVVRRMDRVEKAEALRREHGFTTTPAAIADEVHLLADILAKLDQVPGVGLLQQVLSLVPVDRSRDTMSDK